MHTLKIKLFDLDGDGLCSLGTVDLLIKESGILLNIDIYDITAIIVESICQVVESSEQLIFGHRENSHLHFAAAEVERVRRLLLFTLGRSERRILLRDIEKLQGLLLLDLLLSLQ